MKSVVLAMKVKIHSLGPFLYVQVAAMAIHVCPASADTPFWKKIGLPVLDYHNPWCGAALEQCSEIAASVKYYGQMLFAVHLQTTVHQPSICCICFQFVYWFFCIKPQLA